MKVSEVMTTDVRTCRPRDTLSTAAQIMWECDCGTAPVVDDEKRPIGMITDRDICMAAYTQGVPIRDITVESVMSKDVRVCRADDLLPDAERLMQEHQIRRLPVVDANRRLVGIVSLGDLAIRRDARSGARDIATTIAAISQHRPGTVVAQA